MAIHPTIYPLIHSTLMQQHWQQPCTMLGRFQCLLHIGWVNVWEAALVQVVAGLACHSPLSALPQHTSTLSLLTRFPHDTKPPGCMKDRPHCPRPKQPMPGSMHKTSRHFSKHALWLHFPKPMHCAAVAVAAAGFLFFKRRRDSGQAGAGSGSSSSSTADDEAPQISPSRGPPQLATIAGTQPVSRIS